MSQQAAPVRNSHHRCRHHDNAHRRRAKDAAAGKAPVVPTEPSTSSVILNEYVRPLLWAACIVSQHTQQMSVRLFTHTHMHILHAHRLLLCVCLPMCLFVHPQAAVNATFTLGTGYLFQRYWTKEIEPGRWVPTKKLYALAPELTMTPPAVKIDGTTQTAATTQ